MIRALSLNDLETYVEHCAASSAESGAEGDPYFGPYSRSEVFPIDAFRERTQVRWTSSPSTPGWRRAWGIFDGDRIVASADVAGADLTAGMHRVTLGMSIRRTHRRQGLGSRLLEKIITWCRAEPGIEWIDLGVFSENAAAQQFFDKHGFEVVGCVLDRWRVDDHRIDEILMTMRTEA